MRFPSVLFLVSSSSLRKEQQQHLETLLHSTSNNSRANDAPPQQPVGVATKNDPPLSVVVHHTALQTANITRAMDFYSLFGFECVERFRAGPARAAWLEQQTRSRPRLELIEVPPHLLSSSSSPSSSSRAPDRMQTTAAGVLGYHHVALEVLLDGDKDGDDDLAAMVARLNTTSHDRFGKYLRMAVWPPRQQRMGMAGIYDLCFLYDADGCLVELIHKTSNVTTTIQSGWEPWDDGSGFQVV